MSQKFTNNFSSNVSTDKTTNQQIQATQYNKQAKRAYHNLVDVCNPLHICIVFISSIMLFVYHTAIHVHTAADFQQSSPQPTYLPSEVKYKSICIVHFYATVSNALRHGSHSFTCKLHHACLYSPAAEHHRPLAGTYFTVPRRVAG